LEGYSLAMDSTGRNVYLTGGTNQRGEATQQAVKLEFSMDPIDKELKCKAVEMPKLHIKRANHSSLVVRNHLFLLFGDTYRKMNM
jgi:hypothetical protein